MNDDDNNNNKPIAYSCSGCDHVAQVAHDIALSMHTAGLAEMSSISGVGGNVEEIIKKANSGRDIIAIDGCRRQCVKECLLRNNIKATHHFVLTNMGVEDTDNKPISLIESSALLKLIYASSGLTK